LLTTWKQQPNTAFLKQVYSKLLPIVLEELLGQPVAEAKSKAILDLKLGVKDSFSCNGAILSIMQKISTHTSKTKLILVDV
jgi:hypothetical protein